MGQVRVFELLQHTACAFTVELFQRVEGTLVKLLVLVLEDLWFVKKTVETNLD